MVNLRKLMTAASVLIAAAVLSATASAQAGDPTIDAFEAAQQAAWNAHDAGAYTAAFAPDAQVITALGWHWTGQAAAASNWGDGFKFIYAQARLRIFEMQVRRLTPELASVTLGWSIAGARTIDGAAPAAEQHGLETQLLQRRGDHWVILSQQDTAAAVSAPGSLNAPVTTSSRVPEPATPPAATFPVAAPPVRRCIMARANGQCLIYGKARKAPAS